MYTTPALVFATVAFSAVCSFAAPIKVRRDGSDVQQIECRSPQTIASDPPALVKKDVVDTPVADALVRRFPRRAYYEYYSKRDSPPEVVERSPAPESLPEPRSLAEEASDDLVSRKRRREVRRRSTDSVHYKRTLTKDGVRARRSEPKMKRSIVSTPVAREAKPDGDTIIYVNNGKIVWDMDLKQSQSQNINETSITSGSSGQTTTTSTSPQSEPSSTGQDTTPSSTNTTSPTGQVPSGATNGTSTEPQTTSSSNGTTSATEPATNGTTTTSTEPTTTNTGPAKNGTSTEPGSNSTSPNTGSATNGTTPGSANTPSASGTPESGGKNPSSSTTGPQSGPVVTECMSPSGCPAPTANGRPPKVMDTTLVPTSSTGGQATKRDEPPESLVQRSGSTHWRRIPTPPSSPSLSRRTEPASSKLQYRRDYS